MIVTVTFNPAVDLTVQIDEPMEPNRTLRSRDARFDPGGGGINVAQYLSAMEHPCAATGIIGGFTGSFIEDELESEGINTDFTEVQEPTRLNTTAIAAGEEFKLNQDGATAATADVDDVIESVKSYDPDRILIGGSLPPGLTKDAIDRVARAGDWQTLVDVRGDQLVQLEARYALCKPNRSELAAATGGDTSTIEGCASAASKIRDRGHFERVLASLGSDGAVLATGEGLYFAEALDVDVEDTVGAGDATLSGVLSAWDQGLDDQTALQTGVASASIVVEQSGTGAPDFSELTDRRDRVSVRRLEQSAP